MTDPHTSAMPAQRKPSGGGDLADAVAAVDSRCHRDGSTPGRLARSQARGILTLVLIGLILGSAFELLTLTPTDRDPLTGSRASIVFGNARGGACLGWPPDAPDKPSFVQCRDDHMFEVAKPVGTDGVAEPCQLAVSEYLGPHYDPNGRFTVAELRAAGDDTGNPLCGLQLLGTGGKAIPFKGRIVELDQSRVWPVGTCLGIDSDKRSTNIPVDCGAPHGLEVTGTTSLAAPFPDGPPSEADQRAFIDVACTQAADAYLAPENLARSRFSLGYDPLSPASWTAGSRQVSCAIGKPAEQGWTPVTGSARSQSNLPPPASAPGATAGDVPPVYDEPLIPIGPIPSEAPVVATPAPPEGSPTEGTTPPSASGTPSPTPSGPAPGPETSPSETPGGTPGLLEIPGLPPITLPGYVPPSPAAPRPE